VARPDPARVLHSALRALERWLRAEKISHVFIGGIAIGFVGKPRTTRDVDAIVLLGDRPVRRFVESAEAGGFPARISDATTFAQRSRVFLLRHSDSGVDIDLSAGALPFEEETIRRARRVPVGRLTVPVATPEDLVILKAIAGRPQDIADISGLLAVNPDLDRGRARAHTKMFSEVLEAPEILETLERLFREQPRGTHTSRVRGRPK
jgi:predicted nucleotidyltransferase